MTDFSVVITHFRRLENLLRTLDGLREQTVLPREVIVVDMEAGIELSNNYPFKLRIEILGTSWLHMPLAAARNYGGKLSKSKILVFLDVDCIPSKTFCERVAVACVKNNALVMGTPRYMLVCEDLPGTVDSLRHRSITHPSRPIVAGTERERCYEMFWSLCFAIPKNKFQQVGGFDEGYQGYGAEDTDFALEVKCAGIPFFLSDAEVYHQQHPIYVPPLNHLEPIINNCNRFYTKWGYWPMADCLEDFNSLGFIAWHRQMDGAIEIKRRPNTAEVQGRLVKNAPYR